MANKLGVAAIATWMGLGWGVGACGAGDPENGGTKAPAPKARDQTGSTVKTPIAKQNAGMNSALRTGGAQSDVAALLSGVNNCPTLTPIEMSPQGQFAGEPFTVSVVGTDLDIGAVLTYTWQATGGVLSTTSGPTTQYRCYRTGTNTLTVTVSDGLCTASASHIVSCASTCGNGRIDPTEQCEPPNSGSCNAQCQLPAPVCGNSVVEAGEQCDPPNGTTCSANCQTIVPVSICGNGVIENGEACDPPAPIAHCSPTCTYVPFCGDGFVNPSEDCEPTQEELSGTWLTTPRTYCDFRCGSHNTCAEWFQSQTWCPGEPSICGPEALEQLCGTPPGL